MLGSWQVGSACTSGGDGIQVSFPFFAVPLDLWSWSAGQGLRSAQQQSLSPIFLAVISTPTASPVEAASVPTLGACAILLSCPLLVVLILILICALDLICILSDASSSPSPSPSPSLSSSLSLSTSSLMCMIMLLARWSLSSEHLPAHQVRSFSTVLWLGTNGIQARRVRFGHSHHIHCNEDQLSQPESVECQTS